VRHSGDSEILLREARWFWFVPSEVCAALVRGLSFGIPGHSHRFGLQMAFHDEAEGRVVPYTWGETCTTRPKAESCIVELRAVLSGRPRWGVRMRYTSTLALSGKVLCVRAPALRFGVRSLVCR
jgi:hypothetical protein